MKQRTQFCFAHISSARLLLVGVGILFGLVTQRLQAASVQPTGPINILSPSSTPALTISHLAMFVFCITGAVFIVVAGMLTFAIFRFRARSTDDSREPPQIYGSSQIELAWTVIPVLVVVVLFLATARVIFAIQDAPKPASALDVTVIGHQFWWEFRYPSLGIVTANELHVPVSDSRSPRPTYLKLMSADVDHSFWVPQLGGKTDLIPNHINEMWIDPLKPGLYLGQCAQFCGIEHAKMLLRVYVDTPEQFAHWVASQRSPADPVSPGHDAKIEAGRRVFETQSCMNCHTVAGTAATGRFGPDLTHLMSRSTIASGIAPNNPQNLHNWINKPDQFKPGTLMPAMQLNDKQLDDLVAYLSTLQ
jgi:cytochrome c oxidase subunit II